MQQRIDKKKEKKKRDWLVQPLTTIIIVITDGQTETQQ